MGIRLLILAMAGVVCYRTVAGTVLPHLLPKSVVLAMVGFLGVAVLSTLWSPYANQSAQWLRVLFGYTGLLYFIVFCIDEWKHVFVLVSALVLVGVGEALLTVVQLLQGVVRPSGTFFNPNFLAGYLAIASTVMAAYLGFSSTRWTRLVCGREPLSRLWMPLGGAAGLGLMVWSMLITGSRGALLAFISGLSVVLLARFGRRGLLLLMVAILCLVIIPNPIRNRAQTEHVYNPESYSRLQMWERTGRMIADYPIGVGLGLYQYLYPRYAFPIEGQIARYGKVAQTSHNEYLQIAVEMGIAGLLVLVGGLWALGNETVRVLRQRVNRHQRAALVGLTGALVGGFVHAGVDSNFHEPGIVITLIYCAGLLLAVRTFPLRVSNSVPRTVIAKPWIWASCGTVLIAFLVADVVRVGLAWYHYDRGLQAVSRHDVSAAATEHRKAIALDPGKALYHSGLAAVQFQSYERTHDPAEAAESVQELRAAIDRNPMDGRLHALLGRVLTLASAPQPLHDSTDAQRRVSLQAARMEYQRAIELEPFVPAHHLALASLHRELGEPELAESVALRAIAMEPNFLPAREWLISHYISLRRPDAFRRASEQYQEIIARQAQFAKVTKDPVEERYLRTNAESLKAILRQAGLST